ncbi:MAG: hypothetical protein Q7T20_19135 [Saprospiraceae bacterium]|nr:hypothetical protein [Saprospiraceae bacterium]
MESAQNNFDYSFEAIQDVLQRIGRINNLIQLHQDQGGKDDLSLKSWLKMKKQLSSELANLLMDFNIEISIRAKAA